MWCWGGWGGPEFIGIVIGEEFSSLFWGSENAVGVLECGWFRGEAFSKVFNGVPFFVGWSVDILEEFFEDMISFVFSCIFFNLFRSSCSLVVIEWTGVLMVVLDFFQVSWERYGFL